jgi:hypothetical protein
MPSPTRRSFFTALLAFLSTLALGQRFSSRKRAEIEVGAITNGIDATSVGEGPRMPVSNALNSDHWIVLDLVEYKRNWGRGQHQGYDEFRPSPL